MTDRSPGLGPGGPAALVDCLLGGILLSRLTWEDEGESNLFPPHTRNSLEGKDRRRLLVLQPTIHPSQLSTGLRCQTSSPPVFWSLRGLVVEGVRMRLQSVLSVMAGTPSLGPLLPHLSEAPSPQLPACLPS